MSDLLLSFLMLSVMEIILGIDNIVFISILTGTLPEQQRDKARTIGLIGAFGTRVLLLCCIGWISSMTHPLFSVGIHEVTGRSLILLAGGVFLLYKGTKEIHASLEKGKHPPSCCKGGASFWKVIVQIMLIDIVFSLDSVITAVGISNSLAVMIGANAVALLLMLPLSGPLSAFLEKHMSVKILALSFLLLIGVTLVAESLHFPIPKGYLYFAMGFSAFVELINLRKT